MSDSFELLKNAFAALKKKKNFKAEERNNSRWLSKALKALGCASSAIFWELLGLEICFAFSSWKLDLKFFTLSLFLLLLFKGSKNYFPPLPPLAFFTRRFPFSDVSIVSFQSLLSSSNSVLASRNATSTLYIKTLALCVNY